LGVVWNNPEILFWLNLEQTQEGNWRRRVILKSEDRERKLEHEWLAPGGGGVIEGGLTQSDQSGKTWW
jgi:hypothetical protein